MGGSRGREAQKQKHKCEGINEQAIITERDSSLRLSELARLLVNTHCEGRWNEYTTISRTDQSGPSPKDSKIFLIALSVLTQRSQAYLIDPPGWDYQSRGTTNVFDRNCIFTTCLRMYLLKSEKIDRAN